MKRKQPPGHMAERLSRTVWCLAPAGGTAGEALAGVAVAAVHRAALSGLERHLRRLPAAAAGHVHHLAAAVATHAAAHRAVARAGAACRAALRAARRIVLESTVGEELLLADGEGE